MKRTIVVTGSSRGIGLGMAQAFARSGCQVVVNGRSTRAVEAAIQTLPEALRGDALGIAADIGSLEQAQHLWDTAVARFGRVDVWINNAGLIAPRAMFQDVPFDTVRSVIEVNVVGTLACCHVALRGMRAQGGGAIYNFEGFGSNGRARVGLGLYGSTKAGVRYFTEAVRLDAQGLPVQIGSISPGMVTTAMLTGQYSGRAAAWEQAKRVFNILADRVETVAPYIAARVLRGQRRIVWLTPGKLLFRFLAAPFRRRTVIAE